MITVLGREPVLTGDLSEQYVFVRIDVANKSKNYVAVAPISYEGVQLQLYLDENQDEYILNLLSDMYPSVGRFYTLAEFFDWRDAGKIDPRTGEGAIEVDSEHKLPAHLAINPLIEDAANLDDIKNILQQMMTLIS